MNPLPLVAAEFRRNPSGCAAVVALIAVAVALGVALSAQERAWRQASASVDLSVGAMIRPADGMPPEHALEPHPRVVQLPIAGRLERSGTPWDHAILIPIEALWTMHPGAGDTSASASSRVGPPGSAGELRPVPAVVVRPLTAGDTDRLRQQFLGRETTALFPIEVHDQLYLTLGNVRDLVHSVTFAFDGLLVTAILLVIVAVLSSRRQSVGALRALGAPPAFVFVTVWLQGALLIGAGVLFGLGLGFALAKAMSAFAGAELGFAVDATIGVPELAFAGALLVAGSLFAAAPSLPLLRVPAARLLRMT